MFQSIQILYLSKMAGGGIQRTMKTRSLATAVPIQKVVPAIPQDPEDRRTLERHLEVMGCKGLLDVAWGV